jgi:hypothetical protein
MPQLSQDLVPLVHTLEEAEPLRFVYLQDWLQAKLRAGVPHRHLCTALAELVRQRDRVQSWAGWLQQRLEVASAEERDIQRARTRAVAETAAWQHRWAAWERERAAVRPGGPSLMALVAATRGHKRAAGREECGSEV